MSASDQDARAVEILTNRRSFRDYADIAAVLGCSKTSAFRLVKRLEGSGQLQTQEIRGIEILRGYRGNELAPNAARKGDAA
jgi:DNA-binding Lrp family transcriptional regulator